MKINGYYNKIMHLNGWNIEIKGSEIVYIRRRVRKLPIDVLSNRLNSFFNYIRSEKRGNFFPLTVKGVFKLDYS